MDLFDSIPQQDSLLDKFNSRDHTIADIWTLLDRRCPFQIRRYDGTDEETILVTQVCRGNAYGYPLHKKRRCFNDWYTEADRESVRIPDGAAKMWHLVSMPYDDMDKILFSLDLNGEIHPEPLNAGEVQIDPDINPKAIISFGKYRQMTVGEVMDKDPGYIAWAMQNISSFKEKIYTQACR